MYVRSTETMKRLSQVLKHYLKLNGIVDQVFVLTPKLTSQTVPPTTKNRKTREIELDIKKFVMF